MFPQRRTAAPFFPAVQRWAERDNPFRIELTGSRGRRGGTVLSGVYAVTGGEALRHGAPSGGSNGFTGSTVSTVRGQQLVGFQIPQEPVERLLVDIVVLPLREVPDVARKGVSP